MKSENVKERPLTKLDEYAILISKHWKRSKTGADDYDPTSILVNFKEDMKEVIKNELISDGWTKTIWHKVADGDYPKPNTDIIYIYHTPAMSTFYDIGVYSYIEKRWYGNAGSTTSDRVIAWAELPEYKE